MDSYQKHKKIQKGIGTHICNQFYCYFFSKTCISVLFDRKNWALTILLYFQEGKFITNRHDPIVFFSFSWLNYHFCSLPTSIFNINAMISMLFIIKTKILRFHRPTRKNTTSESFLVVNESRYEISTLKNPKMTSYMPKLAKNWQR